MHIPKAPLAALISLLAASAPACLDAEPSSDAEVFAVANPDGTVVCHKGSEIATGFQAVPAHLAHGDFLGPCDAAAAAGDSVLVCHVRGARPHEIEVAFSAVPAHLKHGDFLGPCE
jgi:hypothetical protein